MGDIKILLVDDEEGFIKTISERLELRDLSSRTAFDGEEALRYVGEKEPDIMVLDLKMPGIDGMEVLRRVRKAYPNMQVIIHTGHGNDLDEAEARSLGVFDYLKKPVDMDFLVERIKAAFAQKKAGASFMEAAAYAEEGEHEMAREIMKPERNKESGKPE